MRIGFESREGFSRLITALEPARRALVLHPLYARLADERSLRAFMRLHVFAVWDFMTLVKTLQQRLTCTSTPWLPPEDVISARLINDVVLGEESDEVELERFASHYELYLLAMEDLRADTRPMRQLESALRAGEAVETAVAALPVPQAAKSFVLHTMQLSRAPTHEVAAAFLLGREDAIPAMFRRVLLYLDRSDPLWLRADRWLRRMQRDWRWVSRRVPLEWRRAARDRLSRRGDPRRNFRLYLDRHIEVDSEHHGPMGERMLVRLCGDERARWDEAEQAARTAMERRMALWDAVLSLIDGREGEATRLGTNEAAAARPRTLSGNESGGSLSQGA